MKLIELHLPEDIKVLGQFYDTNDPMYLLQDILEIHLPNGICIDVGWHPEGDPNGSYRIVVFRGYWRNQLREPVFTRDVSEVVTELTRLVNEYMNAAVLVSCSDGINEVVSLSHPTEFDTIPVAA